MELCQIDIEGNSLMNLEHKCMECYDEIKINGSPAEDYCDDHTFQLILQSNLLHASVHVTTHCVN